MIINKFQRILLTATLSFSLFFSFLGCEDDPPVIFNDTDSISTLITGAAVLRPYVDFISYITPIYGEGMDIDSIKYDDTLCSLFKNNSQVFGDNFQYQSFYKNRADSLTYSSGDTVNIKIFMGDETVITNLKLLDYYEDKPSLIDSTFDSLNSVDQEIKLVWNLVPNADWYGIYVFLKLGEIDSKEYFSYSTVPNFTLSGNYHQLNSDYTIYVSAVTGPIPDVDQPNVFSEKITGSLYSRSTILRLEIKIGEGAPKVSSKLNESMNIENVDSDEFFNKLIENLQK